MRRLRTLARLALGGSLLLSAGCATAPRVYAPPPSPVPTGPTLGPNAAYLTGEIVGGHAARMKRATAAKIRAVAPQMVSDFVARQEAELRRLTAGTGIDLFRYADNLLIRLPATSAFAVGSSAVQPQFRTTLEEIARPLKTFDQSFIDVLGHTDTTGTPEGNKRLSERRASAVADYLVSRGISRSRIATRGYGESVPLNAELTELDRAANRRVEIRIVPIR